MDNRSTTEEDASIIEMRKNRGSWRVKDRSPFRLLEFPRTATEWRLDPIFHEREEVGSELSGVCVATQVVGPRVGAKAIIKMRIDTVKYPSTKEEIEGLEGIPRVFSEESRTELQALKRLTDLGYTATPKLFDYKAEIQTKDDMLEGAHALYVLMEKAPGRNLLNFGELSMAERNEARIAFGLALRILYFYGYHHEDPHPRNIIWDAESKKCHIVDLEHVTQRESSLRPAWIGDFYAWRLKGPSDWSCKDVDPMVAAFDFGEEMPDETELRRVANKIIEQGLDVVKRFRPWQKKRPL